MSPTDSGGSFTSQCGAKHSTVNCHLMFAFRWQLQAVFGSVHVPAGVIPTTVLSVTLIKYIFHTWTCKTVMDPNASMGMRTVTCDCMGSLMGQVRVEKDERKTTFGHFESVQVSLLVCSLTCVM